MNWHTEERSYDMGRYHKIRQGGPGVQAFYLDRRLLERKLRGETFMR
jgi:hypothetical protein